MIDSVEEVKNYLNGMRLKDQIKIAKKALKEGDKHPTMFSDAELIYMKRALKQAKFALKTKKALKKKGFGKIHHEHSETGDSNPRRGEADGLHSESEQPKESGES